MALSQTFFSMYAGRNVEVFLDVRVDGKLTPVTVKLSYEQASDLVTLLEPFRKP
jgi:hypothetical protein